MEGLPALDAGGRHSWLTLKEHSQDEEQTGIMRHLLPSTWTDQVSRLAAVAVISGQETGTAGILGGLLQLAVLAFHVLCVVHVIRRGQDYWWIFLILLFPPIGGLAYALVVMLPEWRRHRGIQAFTKSANPQRQVQRLERTVELADTVENRAELASAYCDAGEYSKAREMYEGCLEGMYEDDPHFLFGLARANFGEGRHEQALEALDRIEEDQAPEYANDRALLRAKILLALGREDDAVEVLRRTAPKASSMEAWWRLATLLAKRGEDEEADAICRRIVQNSEQMNPVFRRREKTWINHAKERLKHRQS